MAASTFYKKRGEIISSSFIASSRKAGTGIQTAKTEN
jgi:hypothetical protein